MKHVNIASSKNCSACGREVDGFKCLECDHIAKQHDHDHFRNCPSGGKMKLKCKVCGMVENNCTC